MPRVSVITTAFNTEQYVGEAILSVLAQDLGDFEYIIVDDASTDGTYEVAESYARRDRRIRLYRNEANLGDYPNRARAVGYARNEFVKFLDSDNLLYPHALGVMARSMDAFPEAGLGLCKIHEQSHPLPDCLGPQDAYREHFFGRGLLTNAPSSAIFRRATYQTVGGFRDIRHRGDLDLWLRLSAVAPVVRIPGYLDWDRRRAGQESSGNAARRSWITHDVVCEALDAPACPLSADERRTAKSRYRTNLGVNLLRRMARGELSLREYSAICRQTGVSGAGAVMRKLFGRDTFDPAPVPGAARGPDAAALREMPH